MKKQISFLITILFLVASLQTAVMAQEKEIKSETTAKLGQNEAVSIFQIRFQNVDQTVQNFLSKNEQILHFRGELNTYILYLPTGKTKVDLVSLLKQNEISNFEIILTQQGVRKQNLFNKKH